MRKSVKYLIYATATLVAVFLISIPQGLFHPQDKGGLVQVLCNAFFVAGVFEGGIGILTWVSEQGGHDIFGYSGKVIFSKFRPKEEVPKYYDYVENKKANRKPWLRELAVCGGVCILIACILLAF